MEESKPNILFVVIDALRADRVHNNEKTAVTPNLDKLIQKGTYFSQLISTSDVTGTCLGSLFSGSYPFETGITQTSMDPTKLIFQRVLKENGYRLFAIVPKFTLFEKLTEHFDDVLRYDHTEWKEKDTILGKSGKNVLSYFNERRNQEPWFHFLHLVDIHGLGKLIKVPNQFDNERYGLTKYDRLLSCVDIWLNDLLKQISFEQTMVVITADHGEYVLSGTDLRDLPNFYKIMRRFKKKFPRMEFIGSKFFLFVITLNEKIKLKLKRINLKEEKQYIARGFTDALYDDALRIPLIISGFKTQQNLVIDSLMRQIDVFPTILGLANIKINEKIEGRNLLENFEKAKQESEIPAYIEVGTSKPKTLGKIIGIRTSKFKYYRNRYDEKLGIHLFDLINDPEELENVANKKPDIVQQYEKALKEIIKNSSNSMQGEITDEEKQIEEELRKLGYK